MAIEQTIASMDGHLGNTYVVVGKKRGKLPENLNMQNLPAAITSIPAGIPVGDIVRSFAGLLEALQNGTAEAVYPVGVEIADTYNEKTNPMVVAHYYDGSGVYGDKAGVFLFRKYADPTSQAFGSSVHYKDSTIRTFLDTTYLENCSAELKAALSEVSVPSEGSTLPAKWFLMSDTEVFSNRSATIEGVAWEFWKQQTGFTAPDSGVNAGRVRGHYTTTSNPTYTSDYIRLRSTYSTTKVCYLNDQGVVQVNDPTAKNGVLPACFIAKP